MSNAQVIFLGLTFLAFLGVTALVLARVYAEGGIRPFLWPALNHGYQCLLVIRVAVVPWLLLLFACIGNGLSIVMFGQDMAGVPAIDYTPWLIAVAVAMLMIHLIDYRHSFLAAVLSFLVCLGLGALVLLGLAELLPRAYLWLVAAALLPLLLWALNGVRATYAQRTMG